MIQKPEEDKDVDLPLDDAEIHQHQKYDKNRSDDNDDDSDRDETGETPDYLATPKKGKGVRRLNKLPLVVVGVLIMFAIAGVTYTFFARQADQIQTATSAAPPKLTVTAAPPVRPSGNDFVTPVTAPPSLPTDGASAGDVPTDDDGNGNANGDPVANANPPQPQVSAAMQRRLQQIQQLEDRKLAKADEALYGGLAIENTRNASAGSIDPAKGGQAAPNRVNPNDLMQQYMASVGGGDPNGMGGMAGGMGGMGGGTETMASQNGQVQKRAFLSGTAESNTYLAHQKKAAIAPSQEIKAGWVIPGIMISGLNSDLPGQIIGLVREGVYDTATGTQCLIPPASRLVGLYDSGVTLGQSRALAVWQRIIYPDGSSISLDKMPGADMSGYAGFYDKVNNHYLKIFGAGAVMSIFSAGIQLSQPQATNGQNVGNAQTIAAAIGQQMGQLGMQLAQKNINIQPTLEIRPGYQFNIMVTKDILLPTWEGHPMAGKARTGDPCQG